MTLADDIRDLEYEAAGWESRADAAENALKAISRAVDDEIEHDGASVPIQIITRHLRTWEEAIGLDERPDQERR